MAVAIVDQAKSVQQQAGDARQISLNSTETSREALRSPPDATQDRAANGMLAGCSGDGRHDDTACLQGWIMRQQGKVLNFGTGLYLISAPLVSPGPITLIGSGGGRGIYQQSCAFGLRTSRSDQDVLVLRGAGSRVYNMCIDAKVKMTAGTAIRIEATANSTIIADTHINNQITGIAVSGYGEGDAGQNADVVIRHNTIVPAAAANAIGIAIGATSTNANTVDTRIEGNSLVCQSHIGTGMLFSDSGGALVQNNTQYGCAVGTKLYPGADQMLAWLYFSSTVLGDTDAEHDLVIDTTASSARIWGLNFVGTWASNAGGSSVLIQDSGKSASLLGVHFTGHRTYMGTNQSGFEVRAGQKVTFDAGTICSNGNSTGTGFSISGPSIATSVRDSTIGNCDHNSAGALAIGIHIASTEQNVGLFTDNDLSTTTTPIVWSPTIGNHASAVIDSNLGLDGIDANVTSAREVVLPPNKTIFIHGTSPIASMGGGWAGRQTMLYLSDGAVDFITGGNICHALAGTTNQQITATYSQSLKCWLLK